MREDRVESKNRKAAWDKGKSEEKNGEAAHDKERGGGGGRRG
jgi:hypothetical protein